MSESPNSTMVTAEQPQVVQNETVVTPAATTDHRANNFDFLRLLLSLLVLYSHSYPLLLGHESDVLMQITGGQISFGMLAVNGFFAISGFLITQSWTRSKGTLDYAERRFLRIYPGFFVVLLIDLLVVGPLSGVDRHAYFHNTATYKYLSMIFLTYYQLPGVFPTNPGHGEVNGSLWTIRYEIICYILVALLGLTRMLRRGPVAVLLFGTMLVWFGLTFLDVRLPFFGSPDQFPRLIVFFVTGSLFALALDRIKLNNIGLAVCAVLIVAADLLHVLWFALPLLENYLLLAIAFHPRIRLHNVGKRGDYSYGVYLYAFPIQQLLVHYFEPSLTPLRLFIIALPLTLLAAFLSWRLVERPALALKPSRRRPLADAV